MQEGKQGDRRAALGLRQLTSLPPAALFRSARLLDQSLSCDECAECLFFGSWWDDERFKHRTETVREHTS